MLIFRCIIFSSNSAYNVGDIVTKCNILHRSLTERAWGRWGIEAQKPALLQKLNRRTTIQFSTTTR